MPGRAHAGVAGLHGNYGDGMDGTRCCADVGGVSGIDGEFAGAGRSRSRRDSTERMAGGESGESRSGVRIGSGETFCGAVRWRLSCSLGFGSSNSITTKDTKENEGKQHKVTSTALACALLP